jgi:hypothetical protein
MDVDSPSYSAWFLGFCVITICLMVIAIHYRDLRIFNEWATVHCTKIGDVSGGIYYSGKTGWKCDDGLQHWR